MRTTPRTPKANNRKKITQSAALPIRNRPLLRFGALKLLPSPAATRHTLLMRLKLRRMR